MKILVTGAAGFIGSHLCMALVNTGHSVIGVDNINEYYYTKRKLSNVNEINQIGKDFIFEKSDIRENTLIEKYKPEIVVHLAAMAGVRNSLINPIEYADVNVLGTLRIFEDSKNNDVKLVVYASSSSVYGLNEDFPFREIHRTNKPNSSYACSKIATEVYGNYYHQLFGLKTIGLRFFTVYGPKGRPDMAPYMFLHKIHNEVPIKMFGNGDTSRDYTYVDDIVNGIIGAIKNKNNRGGIVYNLGNSYPIMLSKFISTCEKVVGKSAIINQTKPQDGDVPITYANIDLAKIDLDYEPKVELYEGLKLTYDWLLQSGEL